MTALEQPAPGGPLEAALAAHARGWRVFPVDYRGKTPAGNWGTMTASPQTEQIIRMWFGGEPRNVGIAAKASGLVMLDEDEAGALERACAAYGQPVPDTYRVQTARGLHWYFTALPDRAIGNGAGALKAFHIDVRGGGAQHGGYVVGAGSVHESGHVYAALVPDQAVVQLPEWVADLLDQPVPSAAPSVPVVDTGVPTLGNTPARPRSYTPAQARDWIEQYAGVPLRASRFGQGVNSALNDAATVCGHFVPAFWSEDQARDYLVGALLAGPGAAAGWTMPDAKDLGTIRSGLEAGMRDWRAVRAPDLLAVTMDQPVTVELVDPAAERARRVALAVEQLEIREEARLEVARRARPADPGPGGTRLGALLAEPDEVTPYRIDRLWPIGGKVLLSAPAKGGKTTTVMNLVRALADAGNGARFLDKPVTTLPPVGEEWKVAAAGFEVAPLAPGRRAALLDFEMTRAQLRRWLRGQHIRNTDGLTVELMRGRSWDVRDPAVRTTWARWLAAEQAEILIVDPIGPVLHGLGIDENDNSAVGGFLAALDALVRESGVSELFVVHHAGHGGQDGQERARGASSFMGWPDALWTLGRDKMTDARGFRADGREVSFRETVLEYDPASHRLWLGQGSRAESRANGDVDLVLAVVTDECAARGPSQPGPGVRELRAALMDGQGWGKERADRAVTVARNLGVIHAHPGQNRALLHRPGASCGQCKESEGGPEE